MPFTSHMPTLKILSRAQGFDERSGWLCGRGNSEFSFVLVLVLGFIAVVGVVYSVVIRRN